MEILTVAKLLNSVLPDFRFKKSLINEKIPPLKFLSALKWARKTEIKPRSSLTSWWRAFTCLISFAKLHKKKQSLVVQQTTCFISLQNSLNFIWVTVEKFIHSLSNAFWTYVLLLRKNQGRNPSHRLFWLVYHSWNFKQNLRLYLIAYWPLDASDTRWDIKLSVFETLY